MDLRIFPTFGSRSWSAILRLRVLIPQKKNSVWHVSSQTPLTNLFISLLAILDSQHSLTAISHGNSLKKSRNGITGGANARYAEPLDCTASRLLNTSRVP